MRIAYVTPFRFPDSSAMSQRIVGNLLTLAAAGHEVLVGAGQHPEPLDITHLPDCVQVTALGELPYPTWSKLRRARRQLLWGAATVRWLTQLSPGPNAVFVYGGGTPYLRRLLPWAARRGVPLVVDAVEWYEPSHQPGGRYGPYAVNHELAIRRYAPRTGNAVVISRLLQQHFATNGCRTLLVPPTRDVARVQARVEARPGPLHLAYAGSPGRKDLLAPVLQAVGQVDPRGEQLILTVCGPSEREVRELLPRSTGSLPTGVQVTGRLSASQVQDVVRSADLLPLLRPDQRYARAGFPTKVTEAMALGTPLIGTLTGDLGEHVLDGVTGLVCAEPTAQSLAAGLHRALRLSIDERSAMRAAARQHAEIAFSADAYVEPMQEFLADLQPQTGKRSGARPHSVSQSTRSARTLDRR